MRSVGDLLERLQALHRRTEETPLFNPVFQLSLDLSRLIESGELSLDQCEGLIAELECAALASRARRLRRLVAPVDPAANIARLEEALSQEASDFSAFRARWQKPRLHAVFTAHPTFLLPPAQAEAVAEQASREGEIKADAAPLRRTAPVSRSRLRTCGADAR